MNEIEQIFLGLKEKMQHYNPKCDFTAIDMAYELAVSAHEGQLRVSGEPFVVHPLMVASILAELELDNNSIIAAILHDVVEDTQYSEEDIENQFGNEVSLLVEGVTKLSKIPFSTKEEQQAENLRKMLLAMAKDLRVVLIKLADRLHNMRTLGSMPEDKQREKSLETMEVFAPLAHRLGMSRIKWELEDLSLRYLDPIAYKEIAANIAHKRKEREEYLETIKQMLSSRLELMKISWHIEGRAKHFYSIYRKMYAQNIEVDQIFDLLAVRIIVDTVNDCYSVLGMVHEIFKPIPDRFKDYIAMPKNNMYQSLHTSLIGPTGVPFEVQIRTWDMHRIAEVGIAAHWKYKEGTTKSDDLDQKLELVRKLLADYKDVDADDLKSSLKIDLFEDEVFVFSPKGDVINLPVGSTPVDFAYAIHSAIGNKTIGAKIIGKIVPLDYKLKNGDIVEILTSSTAHGPSRDWLQIIRTNQAKKKINEWFKRENREENIVRGREMLEREVKRLGMPPTVLKMHEWQDITLKRYNFKSLDDLYATIGYGGIGAPKIVTKIKDLYGHTITPKVPAKPVQTKPQKSSNGIIVNGLDNCLVKIARCCNPVPGDEIIGYITRGRGVSVHRADCINAAMLDDSSKDNEQRFIKVSWGSEIKSNFTSGIRLISNNAKILVMEITSCLSALKVSVLSMEAKFGRDNQGSINVTIEVESKEELDAVIKKFWKIPGVISVERNRQ